MKVRVLTFFMALAMLLSACGKAPEGTADIAVQAESPALRLFTDSTGRSVEVPGTIEKVAVSGPLSQIVLFALCPEKLVGIAEPWSKEAEQYLDTEYDALPVLGQLYGGKGELNLETLLSSGAQVVIDVGEAKDTAAEDLDALQAQTGIPFLHITATLPTGGEAYRILGDLLGEEEAAETLAAYCDDVYARTKALAENVALVDTLYITGAEGHHVIARDSYHSEIIDMMSNNLAVVEVPSAKGSGNEVGLEQIMVWDPEVILFGDQSIYDAVGTDPAWQSLTAIRTGRYYEVPAGPYNWMGFPPSVQRYLGMLWLGELLYPEMAEYDLYEEVKTYYDLFYHCDLTRAQYQDLMAKSIGKAGAP